MGEYASVKSERDGLAVWCWRGAGATAAQWCRHLADVAEVAMWNEVERPAVLLELLGEAFIPNAVQRQQLGEICSRRGYRPAVAVVSSSPQVRGVLRTVEWLTPHRSYELQPFDDARSAVIWLERQRRQSLPDLWPMREAAHRQLMGRNSEPASGRRVIAESEGARRRRGA